MNVSGVAKVVLGFAIAIALLIGGSVAATLYLVAKLTAMPPKPVFDNTTRLALKKPPPNLPPQPPNRPRNLKKNLHPIWNRELIALASPGKKGCCCAKRQI